MLSLRFLASVLVLLITRQSFAKKMRESPSRSVSNLKYLLAEGHQETATAAGPPAASHLNIRDKRSLAFFIATGPTKANFPVSPKKENLVSGGNNGNGTTNSSMMSSKDAASSITRDTVVVFITLTIIFFTLIATYFLWRKHRSNTSASHSVYMYSRLSQNDVEVDNISFQGDLTHKSLINTVPVCAEDDSCDDDQVRPATLCLENDALVTISNDDNNDTGKQRKNATNRRRNSSFTDDAPVNLLMDELSDEDLLSISDGHD